MPDKAADPAALDAILLSVFMTPEGKADPYPAYAKLREATDLHHSSIGVGVLTRYEDCYEVLRDNRFGGGEQQLDTSMFGISEDEFRDRFPRFTQRTESMLGLDPPD